jgi:hypothetical protein
LTTAKLVTSPAEGHGLTSKLTDRLYHELANGRKVGSIIAVVELKPVGLGQRETAKGRHQHVAFEAAHLEPVADANQANDLRYLLQALYEARTSTGEQRALPLGLGGDEERRQALMERMEDWAKDQGMSGAQLEARWRENFGADTDADWSWGDQGVPGDYRKATVAHLTSFCYSQGVLSLDEPLPHEDREDDDEEPGTDDEPDKATVGVKCQVCNKKSDALTDGLCPKCAQNAGIPVAAEDKPDAATA